MHFDDRLATVLNQNVLSEALAWTQYRQLIDLLGRGPAPTSPAVDAAYARLEALGGRLPAARRATVLAEAGLRIANPELLARLVVDRPDVATAAIHAGDLSEAQWLDLIPALPVRARGILRHRRDLAPRVVALLDRLGITDRGLPSSLAAEPVASPQPVKAPEPLELDPAMELVKPDTRRPRPAAVPLPRRGENVVAFGLKSTGRPPAEAGIGDIVRRIEEFRASRDGKAATAQPDHPRLPLDDAQAVEANRVSSFDFTTDAVGRIDWAEGSAAPMVVGIAIAPAKSEIATPLQPDAANLLRRRQPIRNLPLQIEGAAAVAGDWRIDATPSFDDGSGHFVGYLGRARRALPVKDTSGEADRRDAENDRMRQVLHELRTPANAIQFAAGFIQQEMGGAIAHDYRALAAAILGDIAQILAGFDELDRLVRLETGALSPGKGPCDLVAVAQSGIARLAAWSQSRGSGFALAGAATLPAAIDAVDAEQLVRRLMAMMAWHSAAGEILPVTCDAAESHVTISIGLPEALSEADAWDNALAPGGSPPSESPLTGRFGLGFTFRLAQAEATGAGGTLRREANVLVLTLPGLTATIGDHSETASPRSIRSA